MIEISLLRKVHVGFSRKIRLSFGFSWSSLLIGVTQDFCMSKSYCFYWLAESVWMHETFSWTSAKKHIQWYAECSGINFWGFGNKLVLRKITWNESRGSFCGLLHPPIVIVFLFCCSPPPVFFWEIIWDFTASKPTFIFIREALIFMQHDNVFCFYHIKICSFEDMRRSFSFVSRL